jgi:hypothetical protein
MQQITVETGLFEQLAKVSGEAVLRGADGRVLGFFSPVQGVRRVEELQLEPPLSISQTEELRKERTGKPLSEILKRFGLE